ncbi:MAG: hypothetical protein KKF67_02555 [Nanoarchaeota archaeon]|nr:hypothetical protein [Nanoarchaeota archaeon]
MLNVYEDFEEERKVTENFIKEKVCKKWNFNQFKNLKFVKDDNRGALGSVEPLPDNTFNIRLEPNNIKNLNFNFNECLTCIAIHECFHIIFPELNQTEAFKIKDETGDNGEYLRIENLNWNYVIKYFPEFKLTVEKLKKIYGG